MSNVLNTSHSFIKYFIISLVLEGLVYMHYLCSNRIIKMIFGYINTILFLFHSLKT